MMNDAYEYEYEVELTPVAPYGTGGAFPGEDDELFEREWETRRRGGRRPSARSRPNQRQAAGGGRRSDGAGQRSKPGGGRSQGKRSALMRRIQQCLDLPVTGVMGPETRTAIRNFQEQKGLSVTGIAGRETRQALKEKCRRPPSVDEEWEMLSTEMEASALSSTIVQDDDLSRRVSKSITHALLKVNPGPNRTRNRRAAIQSIDAALQDLDRIGNNIGRYPGLRPIERGFPMVKFLKPARQSLLSARQRLVAAAPPGKLLTAVAANFHFNAAYDYLTNTRQRWNLFITWHKALMRKHLGSA